MTLKELIERWRERAGIYENEARRFGFDDERRKEPWAIAGTYEACADDLEEFVANRNASCPDTDFEPCLCDVCRDVRAKKLSSGHEIIKAVEGQCGPVDCDPWQPLTPPRTKEGGEG